jgi:hypothetical protein
MPSDGRTAEQLRHEIEAEREQLANAVEELRTEMGEAANVTAKLRAKLPLVAVGAVGAGFVLAGGIGATMRLVFRRGREGTERARLGRFAIIGRD